MKRDYRLIPSLELDTNEKPFSCQRCSKSYARRDVYQKHLRTHDPKLAAPGSKRQNATQACDLCHDRKVKCHPHERPCPRCRAAGLNCTFRGSRDDDASLASPRPCVQEDMVMTGQGTDGLGFEYDASAHGSLVIFKP